MGKEVGEEQMWTPSSFYITFFQYYLQASNFVTLFFLIFERFLTIFYGLWPLDQNLQQILLQKIVIENNFLGTKLKTFHTSFKINVQGKNASDLDWLRLVLAALYSKLALFTK